MRFVILPLEEKNCQQIVFPFIFKMQTVFTPISRHAELLKIYFKLLVKKLKFSTSVDKSDLNFIEKQSIMSQSM